MTKVTLKTLRFAFFAVGCVLFGGIVQKIGWEAVQNNLLKLGWVAGPVFLTGVLWYLCYTLAWKQIIKYQENDIPLFPLFRSKIAGEAVNTLQPANFLGGDPIRIYLLRRLSNITCLTASVVVDRTINSMAIVSVIFVGAVFAFLKIQGLPKQVLLGAPVFLVVTSSLIVFFLLRQKKGLFDSILKLGMRLHLFKHWCERHREKAVEIDEKVLKLYQKSRAAFWEAFVFHVAGRVLGIVEIYLIGKALTPDFTFLFALFLATLSPIINMAFAYIPGALGVMEGAYTGALYLLGLDPAVGFTIQMVKRIRALFWIGLGMGFIYLIRHPQTGDYNRDPLRQSP